ncbi:MAG: hypothetical protein ACOC4E_01340, partial [Patescibacteria group bacterium]
MSKFPLRTGGAGGELIRQALGADTPVAAADRGHNAHETNAQVTAWAEAELDQLKARLITTTG